MTSKTETTHRDRMENALWGLFVGDSLSMPAHWFYDLDQLKETFNGGIEGYVDAPHPHPESFMVGMEYMPDVEKANSLGRSYDILHEHGRFYETSYGKLEIELGGSDGEHGNSMPKRENRYHYHHGLKAGQLTTGAELVRVMMRGIIDEGRYVPERFLEDFITFLTTPGKRKNPYLEIYIRDWFEHYASGKDPRDCAQHQREVWSIGSHGGMIRPMVLSMLAPTSYQGLGFSLEHQVLTHRSENVAAALGITIPLLHDLLDGCPAMGAAPRHSASLRVPTMTGEELHRIYRKHDGPGSIPDEEMWRIHTQLSGEAFDLRALLAAHPLEDLILKRFGTVCYPEHGLPLMLAIAGSNDFAVEPSLLTNANAGGDNVHRGAILGLLVGAAAETFPEALKSGLEDSDILEQEIRAFTELAIDGDIW